MVARSFKALALAATAVTSTAAEIMAPQANMTAEYSSQWSLYSFAQSWQPEFCYGQSSYMGCSSPDDFWSTSLTIHGMWPDVTSGTYPSHCSNEPFDLDTVTSAVSIDALFKYWPNVKADPSSSSYTSFWSHEWSTHGTCSGLDQATYFQTAVSLLVNNPTPDFVANNVGNIVDAESLRAAYGGDNGSRGCDLFTWTDPAGTPIGLYRDNQVVLQCSGKFLRQVLTCFTRGSDNLPGARRAYPANLLAEDNCSGSSITISSF